MIRFARAGPIPGSCSSSVWVAVLTLMCSPLGGPRGACRELTTSHPSPSLRIVIVPSRSGPEQRDSPLRQQGQGLRMGMAVLVPAEGYRKAIGVRPSSAAHNAVGLAGESPVVGIDCLPT